ncbi:MAG TPA: LLM class F420-dependent oxidoreductase [Acidimicrobiales bacterium]|nr:LLM class F420-dependent oxidoreductase [Acidimicrobiales bacterium]
MRIGIHTASSGNAPNAIVELIGAAQGAADAGLAAFWLPQLFDVDALTALAVIGREVSGIELGTAVVPTYPRHPLVLAGQALTAQAACGNRLTLGIGLSHQVVIEGMFGYSFDKPARHMREYLSILGPLIRGEQVSFHGKMLKAATMAPMSVAGAEPCPILVAALAPVMLKLAGQLADGTVTWMVGPKTLANHVAPTITASAAAVGRPAPRVVVGIPVCVTNEPDQAREQAAKTFVIYGQLPSYRAMLDKEGAEGPADVAVVGDEEAVAAQLAEFGDAGATEMAAAIFGSSEERRRTLALLSDLTAAS